VVAVTGDRHDDVGHDDVRFITSIIEALDRRVDTLYQGFKDEVDHRFEAVDLRNQQRYDAQQTALKDALTAQDKAVSAALNAAEKAVAKAEVASEKRFDSVNEFRGQLSDQAATFMPRAEAEAQYRSMTDKIDDLKSYRAATAGIAAGRSQWWGWLVAAVGLFATVIGIATVLR
jgi:hypothetical protein